MNIRCIWIDQRHELHNQAMQMLRRWNFDCFTYLPTVVCMDGHKMIGVLRAAEYDKVYLSAVTDAEGDNSSIAYVVECVMVLYMALQLKKRGLMERGIPTLVELAHEAPKCANGEQLCDACREAVRVRNQCFVQIESEAAHA